jgi:hypothetical protein
MQLVSLAILEVSLWCVYFFLRLSHGRARQWKDALFAFMAVNLAAFMIGGWLIAGDVITKEWRALFRG